jgi:hypothetical protein
VLPPVGDSSKAVGCASKRERVVLRIDSSRLRVGCGRWAGRSCANGTRSWSRSPGLATGPSRGHAERRHVRGRRGEGRERVTGDCPLTRLRHLPRRRARQHRRRCSVVRQWSRRTRSATARERNPVLHNSRPCTSHQSKTQGHTRRAPLKRASQRRRISSASRWDALGLRSPDTT